ncbi:MAG TPA: endo-1,4-beta-xylanase [bacterium]|nr:endo-1,4-beta-xylanase [bacterium]
MKKILSLMAVLMLLAPAAFAGTVEDWTSVQSGTDIGTYNDSNGSKIEFAVEAGPKSGQKAIKLTSNLVEGGYCGIWHHISADISKAGALKFMAKSSAPGEIQVALEDTYHVQYIANTKVGKDWAEISVPISDFHKNPYYTPDNAVTGHLMDLSQTSGMNLAPQMTGPAVVFVGPIETDGAAPPPAPKKKIPEGGLSLFPKPGIEMLPLGDQKDLGKAEIIPVKGQPFKEAIRLSTYKLTNAKWDVQVDAPVSTAIQQGEVMLVEFWIRAEQGVGESGEAKSEVVFERLGDPWTKALEMSLTASPEWKKFSIPFTAVESLEAGKSHLSFRMGYGPQVYDLADLKLTTFGDTKKITDFPPVKIGYGGMEADAPWRKEAAERIEKIRKGDLTVSVTDGKGKPVSGAKVSVKMKRQAFGFGTAVVAKKLATEGDENDRYRKEIERLFNRVVFENDLKWGPWEAGASNQDGTWRREWVDDAVKWLSERHIDIRGHNMVWGTWRYIPGDIKKLKDDKAALEKAIERRIADVGGAMAGKVVDWDVVNESVPEHDLTDIFGKEQMVTWFKAARKADPHARLCLNDYPQPDSTGHLDGFIKDLQMLLDNKAPLGGIGLQGHVGNAPWSIPDLLKEMDQLAALGLPIEITEFDTNIQDPALEGQFMKDFLTAVFSHPSAQAFLMWGFWDGAHYSHKAPIFNLDWTEKPAGKAFEDLVLHDWWTNAEGATDAEGSYQTRGFLGDYDVIVSKGSKAVTLAAKLDKDGLKFPVVLK